MLFQGHMGGPSYDSTDQVVDSDLEILGHFWSGNNAITSCEAAIILLKKLLPTSKLVIYNVFEPLLCCLKGIWVHPYTISPTKLAPGYGASLGGPKTLKCKTRKRNILRVFFDVRFYKYLR